MSKMDWTKQLEIRSASGTKPEASSNYSTGQIKIQHFTRWTQKSVCLKMILTWFVRTRRSVRIISAYIIDVDAVFTVCPQALGKLSNVSVSVGLWKYKRTRKCLNGMRSLGHDLWISVSEYSDSNVFYDPASREISIQLMPLSIIRKIYQSRGVYFQAVKVRTSRTEGSAVQSSHRRSTSPQLAAICWAWSRSRKWCVLSMQGAKDKW